MTRPRVHAGCGSAAVVIFPDEAAHLARMLSVAMTEIIAIETAEHVSIESFRLARDAPPRVLQLAKHDHGDAAICRFLVPTRGTRLCGLGTAAPAACLGTTHPVAAWEAARTAWHQAVDAGPWTQPEDVFLDWALWAFPSAGDGD